MLRKHEGSRTFEGPEYERAAEEFYRRHVLRLDHRPGWWKRALERYNNRLNVHMWEPDGGELARWDVRPRLREVMVPTLIIAGRHDGTTGGSERVLHEGIAGSELVFFDESSHYPFAEEPRLFTAVLEDFLARAEKG
jgi:proline iminopeptidase